MKSVAIIGAGFTSLTIAYRLANKGYKIKIFERSDQPGGLASGFDLNGTNIEKAYHHLFKTDKAVINLLGELGLEGKLKWHESSVAIFYNNKFYPFVSPFDLLRFTPLSFIARIRTGVVMFFISKYKNWKTLENKSAYEWMEKYVGRESMKVIWGPLLKGKFHNFYKKISMAWLWARLFIRSNSRSNPFAKEELGYIDGGFVQIVDRLVEVLKNKDVEFKFNVNIDSIQSHNDGVIINHEGESERFDKVVATVPSQIFSRLIEAPDEYKQKLNSIDYIGAVLLVFTSDQWLSDYYWNNINATDSPFLVFLNHTKLIDKSFYGNEYVYYIGAYVPHEDRYFELSDDALKEEWFDYLKKIKPEFDQKMIKQNYVFKFKNAQHIVDQGYASKIVDYKTPIQNVYLSNFSQIYPYDRGTNYAVDEGNKIAELIHLDFQND